MCGQYARIFFFFLGELKVGVRIICRGGLYAQKYSTTVLWHSINSHNPACNDTSYFALAELSSLNRQSENSEIREMRSGFANDNTCTVHGSSRFFNNKKKHNLKVIIRADLGRAVLVISITQNFHLNFHHRIIATTLASIRPRLIRTDSTASSTYLYASVCLDFNMDVFKLALCEYLNA